ncbi:L,D-transpeptidase [Dendrosporobacter sp. 1207_IL3150]|uniref:L,D-transpeptidase n=1 Tax=Dendrosporobacter sp. 1207_IL3150 TaxID=3084054 RepID=UPI002FD9FA38
MRILMFLMLFFWSFQSAWAKPEIHVNVPELILRLYDGSRIVKEYPVALGTPYEQTPLGKYKIFYKEKDPTWIPGSGFSDKTPVPPGKDNPLGSRWMEFKPAYGVHGTNKDWDIEYPVSGGCIRMHNADVEELYELVDIGTPVVITYQVLLLKEHDNAIYLTVLPDIYHHKQGSTTNVMELFKPYAVRYKLLSDWQFPTDSMNRNEVKIAVAIAGNQSDKSGK